ncbi:hypothetical protein [Tropicibacter alexandrii]|uniref:hypothetical protein n=1 Tax=Tropicibacter alexandrii TaxID=2267683 RepID=UPI000EF447AE|nr:hypothetical protein [Tropicibacter alexandrii]
MPSDVQTVKVELSDLLEVLAIRTKMGRAPIGSRATGLRDAAIYPVKGGIEFEMPGLSQVIRVKSGKLTESAAFKIKTLPNIIKLLKSYVGQEQFAQIELSKDSVSFRCAGSKVSLTRYPVD